MRTTVIAASSAALFLFTAGATAQSCIGLPTRDGQIAFAGSGSGASLDADIEYGVEFHADVTGPASFEFGYGTMPHADRRSYTARAAYELYLLDPSICGVAGVLFTSDEAPGVDERLGVPLGFGIGKTLRGGPANATLYAVPQYVWLRERGTAVPGGQDTTNEFMAEAGVTLGLLPFYVGGAVAVSTMRATDPAFRLRAGFMF